MDVTFSPCGGMIAVAGGIGRVSSVWEFASGQLLKTFIGKGAWWITVAFSPDGKYLATGTGPTYRGGDRPGFGVVTVWDLTPTRRSGSPRVNWTASTDWPGVPTAGGSPPGAGPT